MTESSRPDGSATGPAGPPKPRSILARQADLYRGVAGAGTLGLEIALSIGLGLILGRWLDARWGTAPAVSLIGLAVGLIVAGKAVYRVMKLLRESAEREEREQGNPKPLYESASEREERRAHGDAGDADPVVERLPFRPSDDDAANDRGEKS